MDYTDSIEVLLGENQGKYLPGHNRFSVDGLYSKMKGDKPIKLVGKVDKGATEPLFIILNEGTLQAEAYKMFKGKCGGEPTKNQFIVQMAFLGYQIGKNIDHINKDGGKVTLYTKGNIDQISLSKEEEKQIFRDVFVDVKEEKRKAEEAKKDINILYNSGRPIKVSGARKMSMNAENNNSKAIPTASVSKSDVSNIDVNQIKDEIKKKVIAQDETIDKVLNNIYLNQRIIDSNDKDFLKNKVNILLDGPTGTGKTLILEQVAEKLSLPIFVTPVTNYSTTGYKGADLTDVLVKLLDEAGGDLELAERGIVAFDEFDKLGSRTKDEGLSMRKALQQELLTVLNIT